MLELLLNQYKDDTLNIINALKNNNFNEVSKLVVRRQNIINKITEIEYNKEEFEKIAKTLNLALLETELNQLYKDKRNYAKEKVDTLKVSTKAFKSYNSNLMKKEQFLKKRI